MSVNRPQSHGQPTIRWGGHSSAGIKACNQDAFAVAKPSATELANVGRVAALADGLSSASHGGHAAAVSVANFVSDLYSTPASWSSNHRAAKVLAALNDWLCHCGGQEQQWLTTFSALVIKGSQGHLYHVGDSQIARIRDGQYQQLTQAHQQGSALVRALGAESHLRVDTQSVDLQTGDTFVLSSDGLHNFVQHQQVIDVIKQNAEPEAAAKALVNLALSQGSDDNLSCLIITIRHCPKHNPQQLQQQWQHRRIPPILIKGQSLDHYKIERCLHASPRSHLYLVTDKQTGSTKVLKAPSPNLEAHPQQLAAMVREAWVGQCLRHPNIMETQAPPAQSAFLYVIGEYIEGQTLSQWLIDHPNPSLSQLRPIIDGILGGLRAMQRQQLVHRDLKPDNVMIDHQGRVKLVDFGSISAGALSEHPDWYQQNQAVGTTDYSAPECQLNGPVDVRSDLFSVAVMLYEALCGKLPFASKRPGQRQQFGDWRYQHLRQWQPKAPLWLDALLEAATKPDPATRMNSLSEFRQRLHHPQVDTPSWRTLPLAKRHPVRFWQSISALLLLALIAALLS